MAAVVTQAPNLLRIAIPVRRAWFKVGLVALWLAGWILAERTAAGILRDLQPRDGTPTLMLLVLGLWTLAALIGVFLLVWLVWGREVVTVTPDSIAIRNEISGAGRRREFEMAYVERIRLRRAMPAKERQMLTPGLGRAGWIEFDYRFRTYRFGTSIDRPEALGLLRMIAEIAPGRMESDPRI